MLVNRRANFQLDNTDPSTTLDLDNCFSHFPAQTIQFNYSDLAESEAYYGTNVGLFDPCTEEIYNAMNQIINIPLDAGDGVYLQMVATLPSIVQDSISVHKNAIVNGIVTVSSGGVLNFASDAKVTFLDNAKIVVESGGHLFINASQCVFGQNAAIEVIGGSLDVNGGNWGKNENAASWAGIRASASSDITLNDVVISNAYYNSVNNSNLEVTNCRFNVPSDGFGLLISNSTEGFSTRITNNESGKGFFGNTYQNTRGIVLGSTKNPVVLDSVYFNNLMTGIWKNSNVSVRDSITGCTFSNCNTGINIISSDYGGLIESCNFNQTIQDSTAAGIRLIAANPRISECDFHTHRGIVTEYSIDTFSRDSGVFDCDFDECNTEFTFICHK